ncbi:MAG: class I SAM-dependent methyltransferase [Candidatus Paceibacterota bacterium]|jgi:SAM-dependent methyltransferase
MENQSSKQKEAYCIFADFYDRLMSEKKYKAWNDLIAGTVKKYSIPRGVCLDIACGTGRISGMMIKQGFQVVGIDKAEKMIDIARKNFPGANFLKSDIRDFTVSEPDKAVMAVSFYDSLNYLLTDNDMLKMFKTVEKNLAPGAVFLFDMNTREHVAVSQKNKPKVFELEKENLYTVFKFSGKGRTWILDIDLFVKQNNGLYELYKERHIERGYDEKDISLLLKKTGFQLLEVKKEYKTYEDGKKHLSRLYFIVKKRLTKQP